MCEAFYRTISRVGWRIVMFGDGLQERHYATHAGRYENFLNDEYQNLRVR